MGIAYKDFISGDPAAVADELWWDWFARDAQLAPMTADLQTAARELEAQLPTGLQVFAKENPSAVGNVTHARLMFNEEQGGDVVACLEVQYPSGRVALYKAPDFNTPVQKWHIDVTAKPIGGPDDDYEDEYEDEDDEGDEQMRESKDKKEKKEKKAWVPPWKKKKEGETEAAVESLVSNLLGEVSRYEGPGPSEGPELDTGQTMIDAVKLLADLNASYEYPGFISVDVGDMNFAFGDVNGPFGCDYGPIETTPEGEKMIGGDREGCDEEIPNTSTPEELAAFVRRVVAAHTTQGEPVEVGVNDSQK
jgi:hypothetical protein